MTSFPKSSAEIITEIADHLIKSEGLPPDTPRPTLADLETSYVGIPVASLPVQT